jgi:hypothetical protein
MVDSVQVFDPSYRVTDANGAPVNGAKIKFFEVGPGATKTVYSDKNLSVGLGVIVYTRADGYPVVSQGSNTTTLIFLGNTPYYIVITDANDVPIFPAKDNVRGAVDTSTFLVVGSTSTLSIPQISTAIDLTLAATHKGKLIAASAGCTLTLTAAATLLDGWSCKIRNDSAAARVVLSSSDTIHSAMGSVSAFAIGPGAAIEVTCNGASFEIVNMTPAYFVGADVLAIVSRVASAPGSPTAGARYIATGVFTAGVVTTAAGDIIEANGVGNWFKITPPTDVGWLAFVQDENAYYAFQDSAWVQLIDLAATQADMEAASSLLRVVTPGVVKYHPGVAKAWAEFDSNGTIQASYNVSSITDNGTGSWTPNFTVPFSSSSYSTVITCLQNAVRILINGAQNTGAINVQAFNSTFASVDCTNLYFACFGDQ